MRPRSPHAAECIKLRKEERLSVPEIVRRTGLPKTSVAFWVRGIPLTKEEVRCRLSVAGRLRDRPGPRVPRGEESKFHKVIPLTSLAPAQRGRLAELAVSYRLCLMGLEIYGAVCDGGKVDFIVRDPKTARLQTIQVKLVKESSNATLPSIDLRCSAGRGRLRRYAEGEFDFIVGYDYVTDTAYVFSWEEAATKAKAITVRQDAAEAWHKLLRPIAANDNMP